MPYLRAESATTSAGNINNMFELRSSKTLIGTAASKCDVVLDQDNVLELHALLNLSTDKVSGTLVPFSTSGSGVCYVNDREVPHDGTTVVHGDRIAFGSPTNAFFFELTPSPSLSSASQYPRRTSSSLFRSQANLQSSVQRSTNNSASFRRALDALRGDRISTKTIPTPTNQPTRKKKNSLVNSTSSSKASVDTQLSKFLLEASSDSLLSEYVERKLLQSSNRRRAPPTAMEPPPSLSTSSVSSQASSFAERKDSLLEQTMNQLDDTAASHRFSLSLSLAEQNYAEMEKLRLSQRMREVNNVLNRQLDFNSSYLGAAAKKQSNNLLWSRDDKVQAVDKVSDAEKEADDEDQEESDDELPVMVEKPPPPILQTATPLNSVTTMQNIVQSVQPEEDDVIEDSNELLESLPGLSQRVRISESAGLVNQSQVSMNNAGPKQRSALLPIKDREASSGMMSASTHQPQAKRTALHQQLIDQMIRHKRQKVLSHAFVRWRRGLRIQKQNRLLKTHQLHKLKSRLTLLRRNYFFYEWKQLTEMKSQILTCRLEAFENRIASRLRTKVWNQWQMQHSLNRQRRRAISYLGHRKLKQRCSVVFQRWSRFSQIESYKEKLLTMEEKNRMQLDKQKVQLDKQKVQMAANHHNQRYFNRFIRSTLRYWYDHARQLRRKRQVIRHLAFRGAAKYQFLAWRKWNEVVRFAQYTETLEAEHKYMMQQALQHKETEHQNWKASLQAEHAEKIRAFQDQLKQQGMEVLQWRKRQQQQARVKVQAKKDLNQCLESFLEKTVSRCDWQISEASTCLEQFIQLAERDVKATRYRAATYLIEAMLDQKINNINMRVHEQDQVLMLFSSTTQTPEDDDDETDKCEMTNNNTFLYEIIQQRITRVYQLHQAIAKLAAARSAQTLDPVRMRHSNFLADTMYQREKDHIEGMIHIYSKRSRLQLLK